MSWMFVELQVTGLSASAIGGSPHSKWTQQVSEKVLAFCYLTWWNDSDQKHGPHSFHTGQVLTGHFSRWNRSHDPHTMENRSDAAVTRG